jgi:hypothetical protein
MKIEKVEVDGIQLGRRLRQPNEAAIVGLVESMRRLGQLQPISIYSPDDATALLVTGYHRLEAAKRLGWEYIEAVFVTGDAVEREMQEIAENLHRSDLTVLERDEQIARWIELEAASRIYTTCGNSSKPGPKTSVAPSAEAIGINREAGRRAVKVASLSQAAKDAAREAGLDDNRSALLEAASKPTVAEQVAAIHQRHTAKVIKLADEPLNDMEAAEKQVAALMSAWNKAGKAAREEFLLRIEQPVMDRQFA